MNVSRNVLTLFSASKIEKQLASSSFFACVAYCIDPDDIGSTFLRNVGKFLPDYMVLRARIQYSSFAGVRTSSAQVL